MSRPTSFLLDTNVVSDLRGVRSGRADPGLIRWHASVSERDCFLSAVTVSEIETGILRAERRDPAAGRVLRAWLEGALLPTFRHRLLAFGLPEALRCATLHVPEPRPHNDAMIAATALEHGMTLVTRNVRDMAPTGVPIVNPWEFGTVQEPPSTYG